MLGFKKKKKKPDADFFFRAAYESSWTPANLKPEEDYLGTYKGESGKRETDVSKIMEGILSGDIKVSAQRIEKDLLGFARPKGGQLYKVGYAAVDDTAKAALVRYLAPESYRWGDPEIPDIETRIVSRDGEATGPDPGIVQKQKLKGLAQYIAAMSSKLNEQDLDEQLAALKKRGEQLKINTTLEKELLETANILGFRRYKRALIGLKTNLPWTPTAAPRGEDRWIPRSPSWAIDPGPN